jgi:Carboxypeptidase regulatory-like domain
MLHKLGYLVLTLGLVLPTAASVKPGSISGYVRDSSGIPQMGAVVEVLGSASRSLRVFTDERGFYTAAGLLPGLYNIKVSAPSFLPSLRERVGLRPGSTVLVNVTLNTIFESFQLAPISGASLDDDWKWTLRSVSNRPVLRMVDDSPVIVSAGESNDHALKGTVSFVAGAGSDSYGSSDLTTGFSLEHSLFSQGTLAFNGNVGYGAGEPATAVRASYSHNLPNGSHPEIAFTMKRFATPDPNLHTLQALTLSASDGISIGSLLDLNFGSELQSIQFMGKVNAFRPYGSADLHLSPDTVIEYRYATSVPNTRMSKGFDSAPMDLSETDPRISLVGFAPGVERGQHHELSISRRAGKTSVQLAFFSDRLSNPALMGVGDVTSDGGEVLPDVYSGTFAYRGTDLSTHGMRAVLEQKLNADLRATLDYSYGGVLDLINPGQSLETARGSLRTVSRHAFTGKMAGSIPRTKTKWIASYKWTNGQALTPVDLFNVSAGQADPYLNLFIRQPIPPVGFLPAHMEVLLEIRNLIAQGYVPVMGRDGQTLYLVQSARTVRGGVAFNF